MSDLGSERGTVKYDSDPSKPRRGRAFRDFSAAGKPDPDAAAQLRFCPCPAVMSFGDFLYHGQTQTPGAFASFCRRSRVEQFEYFFGISEGETSSVVADRDDLAMGLICDVHFDSAERAIAHVLKRIDNEIREYPVQIGPIREDRPTGLWDHEFCAKSLESSAQLPLEFEK